LSPARSRRSNRPRAAAYRVEALERNALGLHETVDFHEFEAPDLPTALVAADTWLREKDFDQTTATEARIMIGERIIAEKELGQSTWNDPS
jgi:hypothetical protein